MANARKARLGKGLRELRPKPPMIDLPDDAPLAPVGHNVPPELTGFAKLAARKTELVATASAWLNTFDLAKGRAIDTAENAAKLSGFKKQAREFQKEVDAALKAERKPHQDKVKELGDQYFELSVACTMIMDKITPLQTDWLKREQAELDRVAREKREQAEAEQRRADELVREADRLADEALQGSNTMAMAIAAEEQQRQADRIAKEANAAAGLRAKVGSEFRVDGVKRSASLVTLYAYEVRNARVAAEAFIAMHPNERPKALIEALEAIAEHLHKQDRSRTFPGIVITESQVARG